MKVLLTFIIILFCSSAFAKGESVYKSETTTKNGVVIESKETKVCTETTKLNYGLVDFITDPENEDLVVLGFIFLLTHL